MGKYLSPRLHLQALQKSRIWVSEGSGFQPWTRPIWLHRSPTGRTYLEQNAGQVLTQPLQTAKKKGTARCSPSPVSILLTGTKLLPYSNTAAAFAAVPYTKRVTLDALKAESKGSSSSDAAPPSHLAPGGFENKHAVYVGRSPGLWLPPARRQRHLPYLLQHQAPR